MDSNSWARKVATAQSVDDVVAMIRQYLDTRDSGEMEKLPEACVPPPNLGRAEISEFAYRLAAYHNHDDDARLVTRMAAVLSRAAVRIAELDRAGPETQSHAIVRASRKELRKLGGELRKLAALASGRPALRPAIEAMHARYEELMSIAMESRVLHEEMRREPDFLRKGHLARRTVDVQRHFNACFSAYSEAFNRAQPGSAAALPPARRSPWSPATA